jgi:GTP-binding protein Era
MKSGFVAIVGRPNSGKSTLINSVLGQQISIVSPKAQTTRDQVLGILTEKEGQIVFVDTPGVHKAKEGGINHYMVNQVRDALEDPQLIWYLVDPASRLEYETAVLEMLAKAKAPVILLLNKFDQTHKKKVRFPLPVARFDELEKSLVDAMKEQGIQVLGTRKISALTEAGLLDLMEETWKLLPEGQPYYPDSEQVSDRPTRFFVAEKIREQLFHLLGDEVPYSCAVEIVRFEEKTQPPRIEAVIHEERDSQKGIVIGQGAKKIKEIGQAARQEIEEFLGQKIFLGLQVKLLPDWSRDAVALERMGYFLPKKDRTKKGSKK